MVEAHPRAMLLVDETYRELTFGIAPPLAASRSSRVISVSSLSKAYGLPGIRLGWLVTTHAQLAHDALAAKEQMVITGSTVDEAIGYEALRRRDELLPPIRERSRRALATTRDWMAGQEIFEWLEPRGGVVGFPRFRDGIRIDTDAFYAQLFERHGTIVGPGHWFEQPDRSFRLGFGWPTHDELAGGLAALSETAARLS
jgi:aspartate/methionine/tyrosine aminotransferase